METASKTRKQIKIPLAALKSAGACSSEYRKVAELFPGGVPVSVSAAKAAMKAYLDICWMAGLLSPPARAEYDKVTAAALAEYDKVTAAARAEYDKVTAAAWAEYDKVTAAAWAEYDKVTAPALAEYDKVTAAAWAEYDKVTAPARAEYGKVTAPALVAGFISDYREERGVFSKK